MKGKGTKEDIGIAIKSSGGSLTARMAAARQWGLTTGVGTISATALAKKILLPIDANEEKQGRQEAYFHVKLFKEIYDTYALELPQKPVLKNILMRTYDIKDVDAAKLVEIMYWAKKEIFADGETGVTAGSSDEDKEGNLQTTISNVNVYKSAFASSINKELYDLILYLGRLQEKVQWESRRDVEASLKILKEKANLYPLTASQIDLLITTIMPLDDIAFAAVLKPLVDNLDKVLAHELHIS